MRFIFPQILFPDSHCLEINYLNTDNRLDMESVFSKIYRNIFNFFLMAYILKKRGTKYNRAFS